MISLSSRPGKQKNKNQLEESFLRKKILPITKSNDRVIIVQYMAAM